MKTKITIVNMLFLLFTITPGYLFTQSPPVLSSDFCISVELTSTAINRALDYQYNQVSFPKEIPFSINELGITGTLELEKPVVVLNQNLVKIEMQISCTSNQGNFSFTVQPSVSLNPGSITLSQITAYLNDFTARVHEISGIPNWLKELVIQKYNDLQLWIYPAKLLTNTINSDWLNQRNIDISDFSLSWMVMQDKIILKPTININSRPPEFSIDIHYLNGSLHEFIITPKIKVKVERIILSDFNSQTILDISPDVWCTKNAATIFPFYQPGSSHLPTGPYPAILYLTIADEQENTQTFYIRKYTLMIVEGEAQGFDPGPGIN